MAIVDAATATGEGLPAAIFQMSTAETWALAFSFADVVTTASGDTPSGATCTLVDKQTGRSVGAAISSSPSLTTAPWIVTQTVVGSPLERFHQYFLTAGLQANANKKPRVRLLIEVV